MRHLSTWDSRRFFPLLLLRSRLALVGRPGLARPAMAWSGRPAGPLAGLVSLVGLLGLAAWIGAVAPPPLRAEAQAPIQIVGTRCLTNDDEVITIQNLGNQSLTLAGWTLEDNQGNRFVFPAGFTVGPARIVRIHSGPDSPPDGATDLRWTDPSGAPRLAPVWDDTGDSAVLRDAAGRVVSQAACEISSSPPANAPAASPTALATSVGALATATPAVELPAPSRPSGSPASPTPGRPDDSATPESGGSAVTPVADGGPREPGGSPQIAANFAGPPQIQGSQFRSGERVTVGIEYEAANNQTAVASRIVTADSGGAFVVPVPPDAKPGSSLTVTASGDQGSRGTARLLVPPLSPLVEQASGAAAPTPAPATPDGAAPLSRPPAATPTGDAAAPPSSAEPPRATQAQVPAVAATPSGSETATAPPATAGLGSPIAAPAPSTDAPPSAAVTPVAPAPSAPAPSAPTPPIEPGSRPGVGAGRTPLGLPRTGAPTLPPALPPLAFGAAALSLLAGWALRRH